MRLTALFVFVLLLSVSLVSAIDTTITVKTLPAHDVFISPIDNANEIMLATEKVRANYKGEAVYTFANEKSSINVLVVVKFGEERKFREEFGPFTPGQAIDVELLPEDYVDPFANEETTPVAIEAADATSGNETATNETTNETVTETTTDVPAEKITEQNENTNTITGNAISFSSISLDSDLVRYILYAVGALLVLAIVIFSTSKIIQNKRKYSPPSMTPMKLYPPKSMPPSDFGAGDAEVDSTELSSIERRIKEIDSQIKQIKTKDAEKKLQEKMRMLEELRHNESKKFY